MNKLLLATLEPQAKVLSEQGVDSKNWSRHICNHKADFKAQVLRHKMHVLLSKSGNSFACCASKLAPVSIKIAQVLWLFLGCSRKLLLYSVPKPC